MAKSKTDKNEARKLLGLPEDITILLSFGIVRSYKGLSVLIDALDILRNHNMKFFLLVAGEFWDKKTKYIQQIERLELSKYVRIDDRYIPDEEVTQIFSAADVLIAPYVGGTQSAVASWGLGFGLPMIVSDKVAAGINDQDQQIVTVTPAGDHHALAKAIENFISVGQKQQNYRNKRIGADESWNYLIQDLVSFS
jgi:glycosyltransferase involved in cell wall biosynthesis